MLLCKWLFIIYILHVYFKGGVWAFELVSLSVKIILEMYSLHLYSKPWLLISSATIKYILLWGWTIFKVREGMKKPRHTQTHIICNITFSQFAYFSLLFSCIYCTVRCDNYCVYSTHRVFFYFYLQVKWNEIKSKERKEKEKAFVIWGEKGEWYALRRISEDNDKSFHWMA